MLLKAGVFALAWLWLPFWLFCLAALALFLTPFFQANKLAAPFFVLMLVAYLQAPGPLFAVIFAVIFYYLLLVRDLLLIDRRSAIELIVLVLSFLLLRSFYMRFDMGTSDGAALGGAFFTALILTMLVKNFIKSFRNGEEAAPMSASSRKERAVVWLLFLLFWQMIIVGLVIPADFIYQSSIVFLIMVLLVDLVPEHLSGSLTRTKLLTATTVVLTLFAIVLASAPWGL